METLKTIQTMANIGRIASKIIFICCVVGACICIAGVSGSVFLGTKGFVLGGVTIQSMFQREAGETIPEFYAKLAQGAVLCIGEAILCRISEKYFRNEIDAGTPFTLEGAQELKHLGIFAIVVPFVTDIICSAGAAAVAHFYPEVVKLETGFLASAGIGVMLIVMSLLCKHATEITEGRVPVNTKDEKASEDE